MGSCEVWWARVADAGLVLHLLPDADLRRANGFCLQPDRDRSVVASALLRVLVGSRLGVCPSDLVIDRAHGKPRLIWPEGSLDFSVSHAGEQVAVAVSDSVAVGVDVERLGRLSADPAKDAVLTRSWVRKEAVIKAAGADLTRTAACTLADLNPEHGYLAALAAFGTGVTVTEHEGNALLAERAGRA
jgi:4'-phosphopantetheinyl transferase